MKQIYFWLFAMLTVWQTQAQVATFAFSQSTGTYTEITGGTSVISCLDCGTAFDTNSYVIALPTAFNFNGSSITSVVMRVDGSLVVGSTTTSSSTGPIASTTTAAAIFSPLGMDLRNCTTTGVLWEMRWEETATEYIFQWKNAARWSQNAEQLNFQIHINKTTAVVSFTYGDFLNVANSTTYQPQVGLRGATNTDYNNRRLTTSVPDSSPAWDDTTAGTSNAHSVRFTSGSPAASPTSGLTFTWTPPVPCTGTPNAGTVAPATQNVCNGSTPSAIVVTGYDTGIAGITYQWEESDDNGVADAWASVTGGTGATTTSYTPVAYAGVPKYYRMAMTCSNSGQTGYSSVAFVTDPANPTTQASAINFTNISNSTLTVNWTNGDGGRRYVVANAVNSFTDPVNGSTDPIVVGTTYSGSGEQIVYDGSGSSVTVSGLNCNTTYYFKVYEYKRCGSASPYTYFYSTSTGTDNPISGTTSQPSTVTLPNSNDFTGFTGSNLNTVIPGWYEAAGATSPSGTSSLWSNSSAFSGTTSARINLYTTSRNEWIVSPKFVVNAPSRLKFKAAITDYISASADPNGMQGTDDKVYVMVSTDACGTTWTPIYTFEAVNTTTLTNVLTDYILSLDAYIGQTIQVAFKAVDGPTDDSPDYDFHIATIVIENLPNCDAPTGVVISNLTSTGATVSWTASGSNPANGYDYYYSDGTTNSAVMNTSGTSVNLTGLTPNTTYSVYVSSNCGAGNSSVYTSAVTFYTGYCIPSSTSSSTYINNFSTTGALTNISNLTSGYTSGGYQDNYSTMSASMYENNSITLNIEVVGGSLGCAVWVDFNNNLTFEATEKVFNTTAYGYGPYNPVLTLPSTVVAGDYRVRVMVDYNASNPSNPCMTASTRTETEDYKLTVLPQPTDAVDWANLQALVSGVSPGVVTEIQTCQTVRVYSQVYEPGVTEDDMSDTGLQVWIGRSTDDTDPATWATSAWVLASINSSFDVGTDTNNNDEFYVDFSGLTVGNHYFASRYQLNGGPFRYGATNNGFWDASHPNAALAVVDIPTLTAGATDLSICPGESVDLNATSSNTNFTYTWDNGAGTGAMVTVSPTVTTTYTATGTDILSGCTNTDSVTVVVNPLPEAVVVTPEIISVCANQIQELQATGGNVMADFVVGTGTDLTGTTEQPTAFCNRWPNYWSQTIFTAAELTAAGLSAGDITSIAFQVTSLGSSATNNNYMVKIGTTTESAFTSTTYFDASTYQTVFGPVTYTHTDTGWQVLTFTTPYTWDGTSNIVLNITHDGADSLYNTQTYYTTTSDNTVLWKYSYSSSTTTGTTSTKRLNTKFGFSSQGQIVWSPSTNLYSDAAATMPYTGNPSTSVYAKSDSASVVTYTATSTSSAGCTSSDTVEVTFKALVDAPTGAATQTFCNAATVADLVATGTIIKWYDAATGGMELPASEGLVNGNQYYASQTVDGCESPTRLAVTVTITSVTAPTAATTQYICSTSSFNTLAELNVTVSGTEVWYNASTGGTVLPASTVMVAGTTYYVANQESGCESARLAITVIEDCSLSVDNQETVQFTIYPNPTTDVLNMKADVTIDNVEVINYLGQSVVRLTKLNNNQLNISQLPIGTYVVRVTFTNGAQATKTFIKN